MAIQMRRGNSANFDPTKMKPGEIAVCTDNGDVYVTKSAGDVVRLADETDISSLFDRAEQRVLGAKNIAVLLNDYGIAGNDQEGYMLSVGSPRKCIIAKTQIGESYTISKASGVGDRFRVVGLSAYPNALTHVSGAELYSDATKNKYTVNNIQYPYLGVFLNYQASISSDIQGMIRLASDPDDTYVPYAMTNRELTEKIGDGPTVSTSQCTDVAGLIISENSLVKWGKIVSLYLSVSNVTVSQYGIIAKIPEDYKPIQSMEISCQDQSDYSRIGGMVVASSVSGESYGVLQTYGGISNKSIVIRGMWMTS